jgi:hypothetical protein
VRRARGPQKLSQWQPMNRTEFLREVSRLEAELQGGIPSPGCISSTDMTASSRCMFSSELENCYRCTHCEKSSGCTHLSHSQGCDACHASAYLTNCRHCTDSAYLVHCVACVDCTYCFGCVGLTKKDFHILNQKYSRKEYFDTVLKLKRELGIR